MNKKPSNRQCEIARLLTRSEATDERITKELNCTSMEEWDEMCAVLDDLLKKHDTSFDKGWNTMVEDFISVSAPEGIDEATLFVAYMNWMSDKKSSN